MFRKCRLITDTSTPNIAPMSACVAQIRCAAESKPNLFVAAEERYCSAHSMFMTHPTTLPLSERMSAERLEAALQAALADDGRTEDILRQRTTIPANVLNDRRFKDVHITPGQAVQWGLVQGVRDFTLPQGQQIIQI